MKFRTFIILFLFLFISLILYEFTQFLLVTNDSYSENDWQPVEFPFNTQEVDLSKTEITDPIILWWTPFTGENAIIKQCMFGRCFFTQNRQFLSHKLTQVLMFYGSDFDPVDLPVPRRSHHEWALLHEESPRNNALFSHEKVMSMFNHTATFRRTSDFPLTLQYLEGVDVLTGQKYFRTFEEKTKFQSELKLSPLVYVATDCDTASDRDSYVRELMNYIPVDSYGKCLHNRDLPAHLRDAASSMETDDFLSILGKYKFILSFENAVCEDYISEKFWRSLVVGSIPVYLGSPSVQDWAPNPKSVIEISNFSSPKNLAKYLLKVSNNSSEYESFLDHKLKSAENGITNRHLLQQLNLRKWSIDGDLRKGNFIEHFECFVCDRIYSKSSVRRQASLIHYGCPPPKSPLTGKEDVNNWWLEQWYKADYESRVLEKLISTGKNYTKEQFYDGVIEMLREEHFNLANILT